MIKEGKIFIHKLIIISTLVLFSVFSTGFIVTLHECCHHHNHAKNDHNHCHTTSYLIKITDLYLAQKEYKTIGKTELTPALLPLQKDITVVIENFLKIKELSYQPPNILTFFHQNFIKQNSQRVYYC